MPENTTNLYLIRHAESDLNNQRQIIGGRSNDCPLSPEGPQQARSLSFAFVELGIKPDIVYTSPAERARKTASIVLKNMNVDIEPIISDELQEMDQGEWTGLNRDEVYTSEVVAEILSLGKHSKAPGGESIYDVTERMKDEWLDDLFTGEYFSIDKGDDAVNIFAFGHGLAIRCLVGDIEGWSREEIIQTKTPNASVTLLTHSEGEWSVEYNGLSHKDLLIGS